MFHDSWLYLKMNTVHYILDLQLLCDVAKSKMIYYISQKQKSLLESALSRASG